MKTAITPENSIAAQIEGKQAIVLAPRLRDRNAHLAWFMAEGQETYYYSLNPDTNTLKSFLADMGEGLKDFDPKFGRQISGITETTDPEDMADALIADLSKAKPKPHFLVIDNLDHLALSSEVYRFFDRLVRNFPRGMQLVVNSRFIEYGPWSALVRGDYAVVIGDEQTLDGGIFDTKKPDTPHLEVYGLAGGNVYVNGLPLTTWDGPLPRNLFYYFVDHPMVTRDEIFETFWPDLPTKEATNVFHVTKRKISERLGYELTAYSGGFYRPSGQMSVHYDTRIFETTVEQNQLNPPDSPYIWYKAIQLYRSPFLHRIDMQWIAKRREQLRLTYAEALIGVARLHRALRDLDQAISYFLRALREIPEREDIHRDLMTIYKERGEINKAVGQYKLLSDTLQRSLGISPSKATQSLYNLIVGSK